MDKFTKSVIKNWRIIFLTIIGSTSWLFTMVKSGMVYDYGMGFWGPNGHDGVWHIAVIESLARGSISIPIFSGESLRNYHIGFDLIAAIIHKLTFIPVVNLYFHVIPSLLSIGAGLCVYLFVLSWKKSKKAALWSTFFVYFGGSWGWLVNLIRSENLGGESMFWAQQSVSTLINPPFALSLIIIFYGLSFLKRGIETKDKKKLMLATFLFGALIQIKVYAGLLILGGLLSAGLFQMIIKRKGITLIKVFSGTLIISLLLFLPLNQGASSSIVWKPFWFLETLMQLSDRLGWLKYGDAMVNWKMGSIWWKAIPAYLIAFLIFWYGNMGTRFVNEIYFAKRLIAKTIDWLDIFTFSIILAGGIIPLFFVQSGTPWNTIQFFYYSQVFAGIIAGVFVGSFTRRIFTKAKILLVMAVVLLTIPTTLATLYYNYLPGRPPAKLSHEELSALKFLSKQPDGVVLTYPYDSNLAKLAESNPPRPLYLYESTAYVSAYSKHDVYLEDTVNLNITGYNWPERREKVEEFLLQNDQAKAREFLKENNIKYIYWVKSQRALLGEEQLGIEKIFENTEVQIFKTVY